MSPGRRHAAVLGRARDSHVPLTFRLKSLIWMSLHNVRGLLRLDALPLGLRTLAMNTCFRAHLHAATMPRRSSVGWIGQLQQDAAPQNTAQFMSMYRISSDISSFYK
ncbi:hypothetical protein E2562_015225 [Oryza meyeriana var. granulata]|uniref:Uncharacterized protein n=1 Tax=Oryza meyeriana var. granulata TaxID=110450 RepID=A0A6G1EWW9_9ORYZ|nr:hypothetical protein E2562_015225 [Oryza meyeriana var. granulata]